VGAAPLDVRASASVKAPLAAAGLARLATAVLRAEGVRRAAVSIALVGHRRIRSVNRIHRGHDRETDVIAFALGTRARRHLGDGGTGGPGDGTVVGDVYVCVPVAVAQARRFHTTAQDELRRLVVHGVLHVLGYDHPGGEERVGSAMWRRQERYVARLGRLAR
jgi:probable rRNA maturation factor